MELELPGKYLLFPPLPPSRSTLAFTTFTSLWMFTLNFLIPPTISSFSQLSQPWQQIQFLCSAPCMHHLMHSTIPSFHQQFPSETHVQGWLWCQIWKDMFVLLLWVLHSYSLSWYDGMAKFGSVWDCCSYLHQSYNEVSDYYLWYVVYCTWWPVRKCELQHFMQLAMFM